MLCTIQTFKLFCALLLSSEPDITVKEVIENLKTGKFKVRVQRG